MANFLFLIDKYLPFPSSNGSVAYNIIQSLKKRGHSIRIITIYSSDDDGVFSLNVSKMHPTFLNKLIHYSEDKKIINALFDTAIRIYGDYEFDVVLSFYRPIETILAGEKIKNYLKIVHIPFFVDIPGTAIISNVKKRILISNFGRLCRRLKKRNTIFALKYYKLFFENELKIKGTKYTGIPNLINRDIVFLKKDDTDSTIDIVYTGSFYEKIRNPEKMLNFMSFIKGTNIYLHLFSWSCESIVNKYKEQIGENLIVHGRVSSFEALEAIQKADFLLNLSNDSDWQVPGKIVEYFSTGKPIINFIFREDDPGIIDYKKYPFILNIFLGKENEIANCQNFILNCKNTIVPFSQLATIYFDCKPDYVVELIEKELVISQKEASE